MQIKYVHFSVDQGHLDHWLTAGPQQFTIHDEALQDGKKPLEIATLFASPVLGMTDMPVERGPVSAGVFQIGEYAGSWDYLVCGEDHRVDQSGYAPSCRYLRSWAYTQIYSKVEQAVTLEVAVLGPVHVWLNGESVLASQEFSGKKPVRHSIPMQLRKGANPLFVRFENVAASCYTHFFSARVIQPDLPSKAARLEVRIPSLIKTISRRKHLEQLFHTLYLDRDQYSWDQQICLNWPAGGEANLAEGTNKSAVRLLHQSGRIYGEAEVDGVPGDQLKLGLAAQSPEGFYQVVVTPRFWEFYEQNLRVSHKLKLWNAGRRQFAVAPAGSFESRKREALEYAARQEADSLERETARMALGYWDQVDGKFWQAALERVSQRQESSLRDLFSLLGMLARFGDQPQFSAALQVALEPIALAYRYDPSDGGIDIVDRTGEGAALLVSVCQILAGQTWPEARFSRSGLTGSELRRRGEEQALAWLQQRAAWGFAEYGSETGVEVIAAGCSALIDLAESDPVGQLAGVLLDKLFFTLALNTYKGVYGGTSSSISAMAVKGGMNSAFSTLAFLMWGQGIFSPHLLGLVNLACGQNYSLPDLFARIASQPIEDHWSRERHTTRGDLEGVNQAAYHTHDALLSSLQDFNPGRPGRAEHVWQAVLGPGAVVFTNHPGCSAEEEANQPGFWRGNGSLPRVAQWRDALVCLYQLPEDAVLGFTHAYFPTAEFDEYNLRGRWAFARKGNTYLALMADPGIELLLKGANAFRELRSYGSSTVWFCQLGNTERDGRFSEFQAKVSALPFEKSAERVRCVTLNGDQLEFGWEGPFLVNQSEHPLHGFRHMENLYTTADFPCALMEIQAGEEILRLRLD